MNTINDKKLKYIGRIKISTLDESLYTDGIDFYVKRFNVLPNQKWSRIPKEEIKNYHVFSGN
jgi:hypothetical protein